MRKRPLEKDSGSFEPPRKKTSTMSFPPAVDIKPGEILTDLTGKTWRLGKVIGQGGFGEIFLVSDNVGEEVRSDAQYVAKIENHKNGPLFVEINCYLRMGKKNMINEWKKENKLASLGIPHYVASGSHCAKEGKYRFLILPRFDKDLEEILVEKRNKFNLKTVLTIASQILDILEYIHSKGIVHSDIKASNILLQSKKAKTCCTSLRSQYRYRRAAYVANYNVPKITVTRQLRPKVNLKYYESDDEHESSILKDNNNVDQDQVYLLDYGLARRFLRESGHREYGRDERNAHAGTLLFCSLDAHIGSPSRRSDLECLGYNMIYWLTGSLPWIDDVDHPEIVEKKKKRCLMDLKIFLNICFDQCPRFIYEYFKYLSQLQFEAKPDYTYMKTMLKNAIKEYGYKDNSMFDFENLEGWGRKQKKTKRTSENFKVTTIIRQRFKRTPLLSNLPIKPLLRKKIKEKKTKLHWSKILLNDPEIILKQGKTKEKKASELLDSCSLQNIDIMELQPTYHMLNIYTQFMDKLCCSNGSSPRSSYDGITDNMEGYTAPMMEILNKMKENMETEEEGEPVYALKRCSRKKKLRSTTKLSPRRTRSKTLDTKRLGKYHSKG